MQRFDHKTARETIDFLLANPKASLARFGDGEFRLCSGRGGGHGSSIKCQPYDKRLEFKLKQCLIHPPPNLSVGLSTTEPEFGHTCSLLYDGSFDRLFKSVEDGRTFYSAWIGRVGADHDGSASYWRKAQELFQGKKIVIVGNDRSETYAQTGLFDLRDASSDIVFVNRDGDTPLPACGAFRHYDSVLRQCLDLGAEDPDRVFVCFLGPAATVLAADLSEKGLVCYDVGRMPNFYRNFKSYCNDQSK